MSNANHTNRFARAAVVLGLVTLVAGCASNTPELDARFGDAVRSARTAQTINPNASANRNPVMGLDGKSAARAIDNYQSSFKSPPSTFDVFDTGSNK
jgi:hypothetical protein